MEQLGKQAASLQEFKDESKQSLETQIEQVSHSIDELSKSFTEDLTTRATAIAAQLNEANDESKRSLEANVKTIGERLEGIDAKIHDNAEQAAEKLNEAK